MKSSRKPGVGPMGGVGAAAGRAATAAATSAGIGVLTGRSQTVEADDKAAAKEIAEELRKLFVREGWVAPQ